MAMNLQDTVDARLAKKAMALMEEHGISPSPENYAVWFHYAAARNRELVEDVDSIIKNNVPFTQETSRYLHNKYIAVNKTQKAVSDAAATAQKLLQEVTRVISDFGSETKSYTQGVDEYLDKFDKEIDDENVKGVFKDLIAATANLKQQGVKMNQRIEESSKEISSLKKNLEQVTIESQRDALTGVYNRKAFEKMFEEQMLAMKEKPFELCLLMLDIDHFKQFNDKFGHLLGDEVLKIVSRALMDILKGRDIVARFGGEEFIVLLPETPIEGAVKVAELIRTAIASKELKRKDTGENYGRITVSIGAARYRTGIDTQESLIKRADDALYKAKRGGRNQVVKEL